MITRLGLLAGLCAVAGVLTGCGSSKTVTVTTSASTTPTTPAATTPASTTGATGVTAPSISASQLKAAEAADPAVKAEIAQAVAACKSNVNSAPTLKAADKAKLDAICGRMATGDTAGVQQETSQVCQQIIKDSVPAAAQAQALASCPKP
ncbi:MAG TPA: hypothetical protein VG165_08565 [Solirubrobacteraceae bacterium]|jgi:hypothetical protein|nr:hypothetical protein [Solirubrobacteraceae bacterium]